MNISSNVDPSVIRVHNFRRLYHLFSAPDIYERGQEPMAREPDVALLMTTSGSQPKLPTYQPECQAISKTMQRQKTWNTVALITLPPLSYLGYQTHRGASCATAVFALDRAEEVVEHADYLYSCGETEKLYQLLLQYKDSDDAGFLWRLARASRDLALMPIITADQKKKLTYEAFDYAKKALEKNDRCFAAHKWYAVCLSDVGDYEGVKVKIGNSFIIKEHLERAIELNPKDATSIHILGYWCFAFAELPWYQRKVAAVLFASPPTATFEEALDFFQRAEEVDPNFYSKNLLMLGKTYMMLKDQEKALLWLNKARDYPAITEEDKQVHKEALDLLKKLNG